MLAAVLISCDNKIAPKVTLESDEVPTPVFVDVTFSGTTAKIDIPERAYGLSCSSGTSSDVVLTLDENVSKEYIYRVKGSSQSGSLTINSGHKLTLLLAGVDLTSTTAAPALHVNCGKRIAVILQEDTENSFADSPQNDKRGAFYTKGHLEFQGKGTLNVTGNARHALCAKEYIQLKKSTGTINIRGAVKDGIHCGKGLEGSDQNYFRMNGGTLNFHNVGSDLIDCDDFGTAYINGGTLNLNVEASDSKGLKADSIINVSGGTLNLSVEGASSIGIQSNYESRFEGGTVRGTGRGYRAVGIKGNNSKGSFTVMNGGNLRFGGTSITLSATGERSCAIQAEADLTATSGSIMLSGTPENYPGYKIGGNAVGEKYFSWSALSE